MCAHKFDPNKSALLDDPKRWERENPDKIWEIAGKPEAKTWVDMGVGTGFFAFYFAEKLGPDALICAFDISMQMLEKLAGKKGKNYPNIAPIQVEEDEIPLKSGSVDLFSMGNLHHELHNRDKILQETYRVLKNGGKVIIWDWKKERMSQGPPLHKRIPADVVQTELSEHGFSDVVFFEILPYHNLFTAVK